MSHVTVARCLRDLGYSLQLNVKTLEGPQHPDRDAQFRYINAEVKTFMRSHDPVVSVDSKKKELTEDRFNRGPFHEPRLPNSKKRVAAAGRLRTLRHSSPHTRPGDGMYRRRTVNPRSRRLPAYTRQMNRTAVTR